MAIFHEPVRVITSDFDRLTADLKCFTVISCHRLETNLELCSLLLSRFTVAIAVIQKTTAISHEPIGVWTSDLFRLIVDPKYLSMTSCSRLETSLGFCSSA